MSKICTSLEQSKRLLKLGIDVNTADMYYQYYKSYSPSNGITKGHCDIPVIGSWKKHHISIPDPSMPNADIPAWSLSALLELMPKIGANEPKLCKRYYIYAPLIRYVCTYGLLKDAKEYDNPVDACYEIIVWLKENNKI